MANVIGICLILSLINLPSIVQSQFRPEDDFTLDTYGCKGLYKFKYEVYAVIFTFQQTNRFLRFTPNDGFPVIVTILANRTERIQMDITNSTGLSTYMVFQNSSEMCCNESVNNTRNCYLLTLSCPRSCNGTGWPEYTGFYRRANCDSKCDCRYCYVGRTTGQKEVIVSVNSQKHLFNISLVVDPPITVTKAWLSSGPFKRFDRFYDEILFLPRTNRLFRKYFTIANNTGEVEVKKTLPENGRISLYFYEMPPMRDTLMNLLWYSPLNCSVVTKNYTHLNSPISILNCENLIERKIIYSVNNTNYQMMRNQVHLKELTFNGPVFVTVSAMYEGLPDSVNLTVYGYDIKLSVPLVNVTGCKAVVNLNYFDYKKIRFKNEATRQTETITTKQPAYVTMIIPNDVTKISVNVNAENISYTIKATSRGLCCMDKITTIGTPLCVQVNLTCTLACDQTSWPNYTDFIKTGQCTKCACTFCYTGESSGFKKLYRPLPSATHLITFDIPSFVRKMITVAGLTKNFLQPVWFSNVTITKMISSPQYLNFDDYFIVTKTPGYNTFQIKPELLNTEGRVLLYVYSQSPLTAFESGLVMEVITIIWYRPLRCNATVLDARYMNDILAKIDCENRIQLPIVYTILGENFQVKGNSVLLKDITPPIPNRFLFTAKYESHTDSGTDLTTVPLRKDFRNDTILTVYGCKADFHLKYLNYKKLRIMRSDMNLNTTITDNRSSSIVQMRESGMTSFDIYVNDATTPLRVNATTSGMCCNDTVKLEDNCYTVNLLCGLNCDIPIWQKYPDFYQSTKCGKCSCQYCYLGNVTHISRLFVQLNKTMYPIDIKVSAIEKTTFNFMKPNKQLLDPIQLPMAIVVRPLPHQKSVIFDYRWSAMGDKMFINLKLKPDTRLPEIGSTQLYFQPITFQRQAMNVYEFNISWYPPIDCKFSNVTPRYLNDPFLQISCTSKVQREILYGLSNEKFQIRNNFVYLKDLTASGSYNITLSVIYKGLAESEEVFPVSFTLEDIFPENEIVTVIGCKVNFNFRQLRYQGLELFSKIGINITLFRRNFSTKIPAGETTKFNLKIDGQYPFDLKATAAKYCCYGNITHDQMSRCYTIDITCRDLCNGNFPQTRNFSVTHIIGKCSAIYCYRGGPGGTFYMTVPLKNYTFKYTVKMYKTKRTREIVQYLIARKRTGVPLFVAGGSRSYEIRPDTYSSYINITIENNAMVFRETNPGMPEGSFNVSIYFVNDTILQWNPDTLVTIQELSVYVFNKVICTVVTLPYVDKFPRPVSQLQCQNTLNTPLEYYIIHAGTWFDFDGRTARMIQPAGASQFAEVGVAYKELHKSLSKFTVDAPATKYFISMQLKRRGHDLFYYAMNNVSSWASIISYTERAANIVDVYMKTTSGIGTVRNLKKEISSKQIKILDNYVPDGKLKVIAMNASEQSRNRYVFTCYTNSTLKDTIYEWYWDNARVPVGLSSSMVNGLSQGSIVFDMLSKNDKGNVTCHVRHRPYLPDTRALSVRMRNFPEVQLNTTSEIIKNQNPVNVSCYGPPNHKFSFKVNGKLMNSNKVSVSNDANVSCYAQDGTYRGVIKRLKITTAIGKKICPNETRNDLKWPQTVAGSTANVTCTGEFTGTASRLCLADGNWGLTNNECVKKAIDDARTQLGRIELGLGGDFKASVESLANATKDSLNAEDIDETIDAFETASRITNDSETVSKTDVENMVGIISNLLAEDTKSAWVKLGKKVGKKKPVTAATVMKQVGDFGKVASEKLNETMTEIRTENLVFELAKVSVEDNIQFPSANAKQSKWVQESESSVRIPSDILKDRFGANETVTVNAVLFRNIKELLPTYENTSSIVNSFVLAISLQKPLENLTNQVLLTFSHVSPGYSGPSCNFWDFDINPEGGGYWSTRGCEVVKSGSNSTVCGCDHLTNFAILMNPVSHKSREVLNIISIVGCSISIICLTVTIIVYVIFWKNVASEDVSKSQSVLLMNLCVSLIVAYVIFVAFVEGPREENVCTAIAALIQYFFLVVFFTMFAEGIDMAIALTVVFASRFNRLPWLLLFSWLVPAIIVGISLGVTKTKGFGNEVFCWLTPEDNVIWSFIAPALLIIVANIICVIFIVRALLSSYCMLRKTVKDRLRTGARAIGILTPLLGFTWLFGIFAINEDTVAFEYIFTIASSLQGLFIFITYCVFNKQIQKKICKKEKLDKQVPTKPTQSTSNTESTKITELTSSARKSDFDESLGSTNEIEVQNSIYAPHLKNRDERLSTDCGLRKSIKPYYIDPKTALYSERL